MINIEPIIVIDEAKMAAFGANPIEHVSPRSHCLAFVILITVCSIDEANRLVMAKSLQNKQT